MSKQGLPYGFGRRTGKNLLAGKTIRKLSNGMDNFDDYWSESSNDEESILRMLAEDSPSIKRPAVKLTSTLRSMTPFSETSYGTSMEVITTSPRTAASNPQIRSSPRVVLQPLTDETIARAIAGSTMRNNTEAGKRALHKSGTNNAGTNRSVASLGMTLNKGGDESGTISRNEMARSRVGSDPSPIQDFNTKKRLRYSAGLDSSSEVSSSTCDTEARFAHPAAVAPRHTQLLTKVKVSTTSEKKDLVVINATRVANEEKVSTKAIAAKENKAASKANESAGKENESAGEANEGTDKENESAGEETENLVTFRESETTTDETTEATGECTNESTLEEVVEETEDTIGENDETTDNSEVLVEDREEIVTEDDATAEVPEQTMDKYEASAIAEGEAVAMDVNEAIGNRYGSTTTDKAVTVGIIEAVVCTSMGASKEDELNEEAAIADKAKTSTNDKDVGHSERDKDFEIQLHHTIEPADDLSASSTIGFVSLNPVGYSKSMSSSVTVQTNAATDLDELDSEADDFEIITEELVAKNHHCASSKSPSNADVQNGINKSTKTQAKSRRTKAKKKQIKTGVRNKSGYIKPTFDSSSESEDDAQIQVKQGRKKQGKQSKKNKSSGKEPSEDLVNKLPTKSNKTNQDKTACGKLAEGGKANAKSGTVKNTLKVNRLLKNRPSSLKLSNIAQSEQEKYADRHLSNAKTKAKRSQLKGRKAPSKPASDKRCLKRKMSCDPINSKQGPKRAKATMSKSLEHARDGQIKALDEDLLELQGQSKKSVKNRKNFSNVKEQPNASILDMPAEFGKGQKRQHASSNDEYMENPVKGKRRQQRRSASYIANDQELLEDSMKGCQRGRHSSSDTSLMSTQSSIDEPIKTTKKQQKKGKGMPLKAKNAKKEERKVNGKKVKLNANSAAQTIKTSKLRQLKKKGKSLMSSHSESGDIENSPCQATLEKPVPGKQGKQQKRDEFSQPSINLSTKPLVEENVEINKKGQQKENRSQCGSSQSNTESPAESFVNEAERLTRKRILSKSLGDLSNNTKAILSHIKLGRKSTTGRCTSSQSVIEGPLKVRHKLSGKRKSAKLSRPFDDASEQGNRRGSRLSVQGNKCRSANAMDDTQNKHQSQKSLSEATNKRKVSVVSDQRSLRMLVMNTTGDSNSSDEYQAFNGMSDLSMANDVMDTYEVALKDASVFPDAADAAPEDKRKKSIASGKSPALKKMQSAKTSKLNKKQTGKAKKITRRKSKLLTAYNDAVPDLSASNATLVPETSLSKISYSDVGDELSPPIVSRSRGRKAQRLSDIQVLSTDTRKNRSTVSLKSPPVVSRSRGRKAQRLSDTQVLSTVTRKNQSTVSSKSPPGAGARKRPRKSILRVGGTPRVMSGIAHFADDLPSYTARKSYGSSDILRLPRYSTASPIHVNEVTCSQPTEHHMIVKERSTKIIQPVCDDEGVRRSKRTRVKPLDWHKNERIIYKLDNLGFMAVAGIDLGDDDEPSKEKKLKRLVKKQRNKMKAPRTPRRLSTHYSFTEEVQALTTSIMPVVDNITQKEITVDCIRSADTLLYRGPHGGLPYDEDKFTMAKALVQKDFSAGKLLIRPSGEKQRQLVLSDSLVFYIVHGRLGVTIHKTTTILQSGDFFFVPQGNTYSMKNLRREEAKLTFYQHKHH